MTITITVDELQKHEAATVKWAKDIYEALQTAAVDLAIHHNDFEAGKRFRDVENIASRISKVGFPRLLPAI